MTAYGKGTWARLALQEEDRTKIQDWFSDFNQEKEIKLLVNSALVANLSLNHRDDVSETISINPYSKPRLDIDFKEEYEELNSDQSYSDFCGKVLGALITEDGKPVEELTIDSEDNIIPVKMYYPSTPESLKITDSLLAFWVVSQKRMNLEDIDSQKEALAIRSYSRPFRTLNGELKKTVMIDVEENLYIERKQFLVFLDMETGRVYSSSASKNFVEALHFLLKRVFEVEAKATRMYYGDSELPWEMDFFSRMTEKNNIANDLREYIDNKDDQNKLEDLAGNYPILNELINKGTLFNEYAGNNYIVQCHTPAVFSDKKMNIDVTAKDNLACACILDEMTEWEILMCNLIFKNSEEKKILKLDVGYNKANVTTTFKNMEFLPKYIYRYISKEDLQAGGKASYAEVLEAFYMMLYDFEDRYVGFIKELFEIELDDTSTGILLLESPFEEEIEG